MHLTYHHPILYPTPLYTTCATILRLLDAPCTLPALRVTNTVMNGEKDNNNINNTVSSNITTKPAVPMEEKKQKKYKV